MAQINKKTMQFFLALADETRLNILLSLVDGPRTVNSIHKAAGNNLTLSAISHQLKQMSDQEIVVYQKKGREKIFKLSERFCWCILRDALLHSGKETHCIECKKALSKRKI